MLNKRLTIYISNTLIVLNSLGILMLFGILGVTCLHTRDLQHEVEVLRHENSRLVSSMIKIADNEAIILRNGAECEKIARTTSQMTARLDTLMVQFNQTEQQCVEFAQKAGYDHDIRVHLLSTQ